MSSSEDSDLSSSQTELIAACCVDFDFSVKILKEILSHLGQSRSSCYNAAMLADPEQLNFYDSYRGGQHRRQKFVHHLSMLDACDEDESSISNAIEIRHGTKLKGTKLHLVGFLHGTCCDDDQSYSDFKYDREQRLWRCEHEAEDGKMLLYLDFSVYIRKAKELWLVTFLTRTLKVPVHLSVMVSTLNQFD
jgi:hypothetical protein